VPGERLSDFLITFIRKWVRAFPPPRYLFLVLLRLAENRLLFPTFGCPASGQIASTLLVNILAPQKQTSMTRLNSIEINAFVLTRRSDQHLSPAVFRLFTHETARI
jgi:hypothetical protein